MSSAATFLLAAIVLSAVSGIPSLLLPARTRLGQAIALLLAVAGGGCGLIGAWGVLQQGVLQPGEDEILRLQTPIPGADFVLRGDALSALFLAPVFLVTLLGNIYGWEYWRQGEHPNNGRRLRLFYGLLTSALAVLMLASNSVTFLVGWEVMAVSAFFLVGSEDDNDEVRAAGWLYLAASHGATLALFAMFALLYGATGSYDLTPLATDSIAPPLATAVFLLGLAGFGLKAGVMPLHFWLPSAHAMAPSHVSAVMSGVLIKSGIYGLVRLTSILPTPPLWWGGLVLALGVISAVLGVAFALGQHDIKRLLAYHSIENIGIIVIGLGLALLGRTLNQPAWILLGMAGCLLHVWNHALFKSLLFLCAGSVIPARHTREIDHLGGLAKSMPWTAACFLVGAAAICGLPPLNGFVSEFLIYNGLFRTVGSTKEAGFPAAALAIPALALMGALAVACFVKVFGVVFLGVSRSHDSHPAHESPWSILVPLLALAACCFAVGLLPTAIAPWLEKGTAVWTAQSAVASGELVASWSLKQISQAAIALLAVLAAGTVILQWRISTQGLGWTDTWGCGYTGATPRMQYTGSSLAQMLVAIFAWPLQPQVEPPKVQGLFPSPASFRSFVPDVVLDRAVLPAFAILARCLYWVRLMQQGSVQIYLLYVFAMLILLLLVAH